MKRKKAPVYIWHWVLIVVGVWTALEVRGYLQKRARVEFVRSQSRYSACETRFAAVLYPRISKRGDSDSMSRSKFAEHMTELKRAGYHTVGLQQICDLYDAKRLLPEKAVAVLLDGHRDTCLNAVPVIEQLGLRATVMLDVRAMRQTSRSFMSWHDLRRLRSKPNWDLGISIANAGELPGQLDYLKDRFGDIGVCGVLAPVDPGSSAAPAPDKTVVFGPGDADGYNSSSTDPSRLSLLRAGPQQDRRHLAGLLSNMFSHKPRVEDQFVEDTAQLNWFSTCGDIRVSDGAMQLSAGPSRTSADVWSVGTHDWSDVDLAVEFKVSGGRQFWTYARFSGPDSFIRLGCDAERLYLQQRVPGTQLKNLKISEFDFDPLQTHSFRFIVRGPYVIAFLDGQRLSSRPLRVDDSLVSGKVGFAIWDPSRGVAACRIIRTAVKKLPCIALMSADWYKAGWAAEHSDYLSYLCPDGLGVDTSDGRDDVDEYEALTISSAYNGHTLAPTVVLDENDLTMTARGVLIGKLADLVKDHRLEGMHLDCRKWRDERSFVQLASIIEALKAGAPQLTLMVSLSPQCYQSQQKNLEPADILVVRLDAQQCDLLDEIARPFRLKTLLRTEGDEPWSFAEVCEQLQNVEAQSDPTGDVGYAVKKYDLKGIALCKR